MPFKYTIKTDCLTIPDAIVDVSHIGCRYRNGME